MSWQCTQLIGRGEQSGRTDELMYEVQKLEEVLENGKLMALSF
jgi:hypothetical protein